MYILKALTLAAIVISGTAHAQSSVTLYGITDVGVQVINHVPAASGKAGTAYQLVSGGTQTSRFGFRVIENLGGSYSAIAVLESGFDLTRGTLNNSGRLWGRSSYVGVRSPYGQLTAGRQTTTTYDFDLTYDPVGGAAYSSPMFDAAFAGRADNSLKYSGTAAGFGGKWLLSAIYSFGYDGITPNAGQVPGAFRVGKEEGVYLDYENDFVTFGANLDQQNGASISTQGKKTQRLMIGTTIYFSPVKIFLGYRFLALMQSPSNFYSSLYWGGLQYAIAPDFNVSAVAFHQDGRNSGQGNPTSISILASYLLSKRTDIYVELGTVLNKSNSNLGLAGFGTATEGAIQTGGIVGIRSKF
ncbi:porin [Caballeronia sordidicola]|uniref:Outer membrane protein (Porin) n=1 Tax=Caballeronia sordidicola TaxID=196367 RepID=A0A226WUE8_CABSO|nr:porin [Caballeronia sordidicola]OXC74430.1 Outer membrane protein (porin) [Caballeronia sordidicola]